VRFHSAEGARLHSPPTMQVTGKLGRPNGGGIFVRDFKFRLGRTSEAEDHAAIAHGNAFPRRA
jgi:hypothetical protein